MGGDMISRSDIMGRLKRLELNQTKGEVIKRINAAERVMVQVRQEAIKMQTNLIKTIKNNQNNQNNQQYIVKHCWLAP